VPGSAGQNHVPMVFLGRSTGVLGRLSASLAGLWSVPDLEIWTQNVKAGKLVVIRVRFFGASASRALWQ
jgi:hypothetical protein